MMNRSQSYCFYGNITICFFFFLSLNTFASPTRSLCRHDQRDALLELMTEFFIPTKSWNKSVDCCSWSGVKCDTIMGEVISLQLSSIITSSSISLKSNSSLFKLRHLRELDLSSCNLHGEIPSSIGNLSQLTSLFLSVNHLVGELPASIGNLNQLRYIFLGNNDLKGNIPTSFSNLTKLSDLSLVMNQFTGGDKVLANLTSLSEIDLSINHFKSSIFPYLTKLYNLEKLTAYGNSFVGLFPSVLLMISSLSSLDISENEFEGPLDFGNTSASNLVDLGLSYNYFDGLIPNSISRFRNLESLDLSHNSFRGEVPRSLSKLVNLSSLDLSYNNLEGQLPNFLWRLPKLDYVQLSHNSLSSFGKSMEDVDGSSVHMLFLDSNSFKGPIPQWICKFRYLQVLVLSDNHLTGSIPQCLKNSTSLRVLNMKNTGIDGFLPDLCINGTQLRSLDVSHNNLVGKLPKSLMNCKEMEFLNVGGNKIKDTFPFWLGSLKTLMILVLRSNVFYGPIYNPSAYLGFPNMTIIDISNNNFVGSLPQDYFASWSEMSLVWSNDKDLIPFSEYIGDIGTQRYFMGYKDTIDLMYKGVDTDFQRILKTFKAIDFSGNQLDGHIPISIGLLRELRLLNLSGNAFTGNIPSSLANITNLETLDLSRNNLSGKIPQVLGNLSSLSNINFSHNELEGLVPQSTQFKRQNCSSFVDNLRLYGLDEICGEIKVPAPTSHQLEESLSEAEEPVLNWIAAAIAYVPGVFCGLVF